MVRHNMVLLETQCVGLGRQGKAPYIGASERWVPSSGSNIRSMRARDKADEGYSIHLTPDYFFLSFW